MTANSLHVRRTWLCLWAAASVITGATSAFGQSETKRVFDEPVLVYGSRGHTAPVRSLLFAGNDQLLTAGLDKTVKVWNLGDRRCDLATTIRPPIWRSFRGHIYCMALSPVADASGQRLLAISGAMISAHSGDILLLKFPGRENANTGEIIAKLPATALEMEAHDGHHNFVNALAFSPDRQRLVSASKDQTVKVWDAQKAQALGLRAEPGQSALLATLPHAGVVTALAFTSNDMIVTAENRFDNAAQQVVGALKLWNLNAPQAPVRAVGMLEINSVVASPDGRWVVVGQENGAIVRYDATLSSAAQLNLGQQVNLAKNTRPVLALAFSHDSQWVAASVLQRPLVASVAPSLESAVEVRRVIDGALVTTPMPASDAVRACAFSPDDRMLAFVGGYQNDLQLWDLAQPQAPSVVQRSEGSTLWDVAFADDSLTIGFARQPALQPGAAPSYERFDLKNRQFADDAALTSAAVWSAPGGWSIAPTALPSKLALMQGNQPLGQLSLEPTEGRWYSYSFIPPDANAGHPDWLVAVGCDLGIALFELDGGIEKKRVRLFAGHNGPVLGLAPSPDGRWLASSSSDQTIRLWSLTGCAGPVQLGAGFRLEGNSLVVTEVFPRSFADGIGLAANDVISSVSYGSKPKDLGSFLDLVQANGLAANTQVLFEKKNGDGTLSKVATTLRHSPSISFFPTVKHEWVLWMPQGYYDTSLAGDVEHLGWHRNRGSEHRWEASAFAPMSTYEKELRRPGALEILMRTNDMERALAAAVAPPPPPAPTGGRRGDELANNDQQPETPGTGPNREEKDAAQGNPPPPPPPPRPGGRVGELAMGGPTPTGDRVRTDGGSSDKPTGAPTPPTPPVTDTRPPTVPPAPVGTTTTNPVETSNSTTTGDPGKRTVEAPRPEEPPPAPAGGRSDTEEPQPNRDSQPREETKIPNPPNPPVRPERVSVKPNNGSHEPIAMVTGGTPGKVELGRNENGTKPKPVETDPKSSDSAETAATASEATKPTTGSTEKQPMPREEHASRRLPTPPVSTPPPPPPAPIKKVTPTQPGIDLKQSWPPTIRVLEPPVSNWVPRTVSNPSVTLRVNVRPEGAAVTSFEVRNNGRKQEGRTYLEPKEKPFPEMVSLKLDRGLNRLAFIATNLFGKQGKDRFDFYYFKSGKPDRPPKMVVLTAWSDEFRDDALRIDYADSDAEDLEQFLYLKAKAPRAGASLADRSAQRMTARDIQRALQDLEGRVYRQELGPGDIVIVSIETHFVYAGGDAVFLGSDSDGKSPNAAVSAAQIGHTLETLRDAGCRVALFLDPIHENSPGQQDKATAREASRKLADWVRDLCFNRNIITFVASKDGPSGRHVESGHGYFAQAVLRSFDDRSKYLPRRGDLERFSLSDFRQVVSRSVYELSGRQQFAEGYVPETISPELSIFELTIPPPSAVAANMK